MAKLGRHTSHINVDEVTAAAAALGPIFPVVPRDKRPLRRGWQDEATTDPAAIAELWRREPSANVGLLCGVTAWALDVDGQAGLDTLADLEDLHRWLAPGPAAISGSGGVHLFFAATTSRVSNTVRRLGAGIDTRARGGAVVLPPSVHPCGARYRWLEGREPWSVELPVAPDWLLDALDPPRPAYRPPPPLRTASRYVQAALAAELERVARAPMQQRNVQLFKSAAAVARFVVAGELGANAVGAALVGAAEATGLSSREATATVASAFRRAAA